jgi:hypothetical protein
VLVQPIGIEAIATTEFRCKKDVPLHLQLVHLPSGWCSGVSEGFIVRAKVRAGEALCRRRRQLQLAGKQPFVPRCSLLLSRAAGALDRALECTLRWSSLSADHTRTRHHVMLQDTVALHMRFRCPADHDRRARDARPAAGRGACLPGPTLGTTLAYDREASPHRRAHRPPRPPGRCGTGCRPRRERLRRTCGRRGESLGEVCGAGGILLHHRLRAPLQPPGVLQRRRRDRPRS